jgi:hypothetical protein
LKLVFSIFCAFSLSAGTVALADDPAWDGEGMVKAPVVPYHPAVLNTANSGVNRALMKAGVQANQLEGRVTKEAGLSPLLQGSLQTIPPGTELNLKVCGSLNSEFSQKGDEIVAQVSTNIGNGNHVFVPGGWYMKGHVVDVEHQKRLGRDGWVEVEFDALHSPDGDYELPFKAKFSTKDSQLKSVAKELAIDGGYVTEGALGGAILSVQMTGLPVAIATHGISVGVGAGVGGTIGLYGGLKRKGKIQSFYSGDSIKLTTAEPITLPGFNPTALPAAQAQAAPTKNLNLGVKYPKFQKDPLGDKLTRLLSFDATIYNGTTKPYSFFNIAVVTEGDKPFLPALNMVQRLRQQVPPHECRSERLTFMVGPKNQKYWLVLLDPYSKKEIARTEIN